MEGAASAGVCVFSTGVGESAGAGSGAGVVSCKFTVSFSWGVDFASGRFSGGDSFFSIFFCGATGMRAGYAALFSVNASFFASSLSSLESTPAGLFHDEVNVDGNAVKICFAATSVG